MLYLFIVGLEMNGAKFRDHARATVGIAHAGIAVQFALGAALALWFYPLVSHRGVPFTTFAPFLGAGTPLPAARAVAESPDHG